MHCRKTKAWHWSLPPHLMFVYHWFFEQIHSFSTQCMYYLGNAEPIALCFIEQISQVSYNHGLSNLFLKAVSWLKITCHSLLIDSPISSLLRKRIAIDLATSLRTRDLSSDSAFGDQSQCSHPQKRKTSCPRFRQYYIGDIVVIWVYVVVEIYHVTKVNL